MGGTELIHSSNPLKNLIPFCFVLLVGSADSVPPMLTYHVGTEQTHGSVPLKNPNLFWSVLLGGSTDSVSPMLIKVAGPSLNSYLTKIF